MRVSTRDDAASLAKALPATWPGMKYCAAAAEATAEIEIADADRKSAAGKRGGGERSGGKAKRNAANRARAADRKSVVAPFDPDPAHWASLPWRFMDGAGVGGASSLVSWRQFLDRYVWHRIDTMLGAGGEPCERYAKGPLRPRPVRDGRRYLTLKDHAAWADDAEHAFDIPSGDLVPCPDRDAASGEADLVSQLGADPWDSAARPAIGIVGIAAVARWRVTSPRTVRQWATSDRRPEEPAKAALAVARAAFDLGLCHDQDDVTGAPFAVCATLPARLDEAKLFNSATAAMLATRYGGRAGLAERLGCAESTVHRANDAKTARPVAAFLERLGRLARVEIRAAGYRVPQIEDGRRGDRQAVVAWLSLVCGAKRPVIVSPDEAAGLPADIAGGEDAAAGLINQATITPPRPVAEGRALWRKAPRSRPLPLLAARECLADAKQIGALPLPHIRGAYAARRRFPSAACHSGVSDRDTQSSQSQSCIRQSLRRCVVVTCTRQPRPTSSLSNCCTNSRRCRGTEPPEFCREDRLYQRLKS